MDTITWFESTKCEFEAVSPQIAQNIMNEYIKIRRKKTSHFEYDGVRYDVDFVSQSKNSFWRSRSNSFYFSFKKNEEEYILRISDHWSKSREEYKRSRKLNCTFIATCWWTCLGERFSLRLPREKYDSVLVAGISKISKFEKMNYESEED